MLDLWQALVLGVVEGLTEFLPVSSTGHLILTSRALGLGASEFVKSFEVIIQLGAIIAVPVYYGWSRFARKELWPKVLAAFLPTAVVGFLLYTLIKNYLLANVTITLWALGLGGLALIIFEIWYQGRPASSAGGPAPTEISGWSAITYRQAFLIGLAQSLAVVPGVSRAAATIIGGLALGLPRRAIVEFSFLLAVPTVGAAALLDLSRSALNFSGSEFLALAVGFLAAFFVAWLAIKYFLRFIAHHSFSGFGWYRIVLALVAALFLTSLL